MKSAIARITLFLLVSVSGCASPGSARGPAAESPAAAVDLTGRWNVSIAVGAGTITGLAVLAQSGDRITGSMGPNEDNLHPLDGVVNGADIALTMRPGPGVSTAFDTSRLTLVGETLQGTTHGGRADQGVIEFVRVPE